MTDIYVGSRGPKWWWFVAVGLVIVGIGFWMVSRHSEDPGEAPVQENTTTLIPQESAPVTAAETPLPPTPVPMVPQTPPINAPALAEIQQLIDNEQLHQARALAFERLEALPLGAERRSTELVLGDLHTRMVFEKIPMSEKVSHVVERGDTVGKLAATYGTTSELISTSNGIERNMIRLGESLRILNGTFAAVVDKTRNDMVVTLNGRFFKRYAVGTGTHSSTPEGDYKITLRLKHPVWYRPDGQEFAYGHPENLLGTHYLKLNTPGIGLHGTWEPETVGSQSSAGCVRLKNEMIEELYKLLPEGTSVRIENGF